VSQLPRPKKTRWYATELATTLFAGLPTVLAAVGGIAKGLREDTRGFIQLGAGVLVATVLGTTFKALQSRRKDLGDAARRSPGDLEAALHTLHSSIIAMRGLPYEDQAIEKLRVTLFVIEEAEDAVVQIVPYVGGGSGGEGTKASARSGIVGRAVLRGTVAAMIRDGSFDEYVQILVEEYATHAHEARAFPDDRFAFLAVPLRRRAAEPIVGVVYMDSPDRTFFSDPRCPSGDISEAFVLTVATACAGLSLYTELRYPMEASGR
jgi:hypothetical protein